MEAYIKSLWESFHFARDKYYLWVGSVIALSSGILAFVATTLVKEDSLVQNRITGYFALLFFASAIVYGIWGLKKKIELEWNCSTGRMSKLLGDPLTRGQEAAIRKMESIHGKDENFSDWLFRLFLAGLLLLIITVLPIGKFISIALTFLCPIKP